MALKLKIDKPKVVELIKSIQSTYKVKGYITVKEVSPTELIKKVGIPHTGVIASNIFDWLVKKGYLLKQGGRGRATLGYKWIDNLFDAETIAARYIQFIDTICDKKESITPKDVKIKPSQFKLNEEVFFLKDNHINHGVVKGVFLHRNSPSECESTFYRVIINNSATYEYSHEALFPCIDLLLIDLKASYDKNH